MNQMTASKYCWEARIGRAIWDRGSPRPRLPLVRCVLTVLLGTWSVVAYGGLFVSCLICALLPFRLLVSLRSAIPWLYFLAVSLVFVVLVGCSLILGLKVWQSLRRYRTINVDVSVAFFAFVLAQLCCTWILLNGGTPLK